METLTLEKSKTLTYNQITTIMRQQDLLIAEGKMEHPQYRDDVFTLEQEVGFNRGVTIDEIYVENILFP
ncbi:MAG: hypothetical protein LBN23_05870 [Paludibacter sp.]|jgi:hypothetical protein|nr:hypothetical protein [Paludibacter sp.]